MCEKRPATTSYGFPVCQQCYDGLVGLQADLDQMEEADPELKRLGQKVEQGLNEMVYETAEEAVAAIVCELVEDQQADTPVFVHRETIPHDQHVDEIDCPCKPERVW